MTRLDLNDTSKEIIKVRYLPILRTFQKRASNYSFLYYSGHIIITVGSLFVPALLSIQYSNSTHDTSTTPFQIQIFWSTWVISLLVTIFNGILTLFKIDKKYFFLNAMLERVRSEGWQYIQLTGRYSGQLINHNIPTHENQFIFFCHRVEKFKLKQVSEEYLKPDDKKNEIPVAQQITNRNMHSISQDIYPPSPEHPLQRVKSEIPRPVKDAVSSLIKSRATLNMDDNASISSKTTDSTATTIKSIDEIIILDKEDTESLEMYENFVDKK